MSPQQTIAHYRVTAGQGYISRFDIKLNPDFGHRMALSARPPGS